MMSDQEAIVTTPTSSEPTTEDWHELLDFTLGNSSAEVSQTVSHLLRTTPSGRAYLDRVKGLRPHLNTDSDLSIVEITDTYEGALVVDRLLANSLYGVQRDLYIRDFALTGSWYCDRPEAYLVVIDLLRVREKRSKTKKERDRLKEVRAAVERELTCEDVKVYLEKKEPKKG
jgi:hypothetical protein